MYRFFSTIIFILSAVCHANSPYLITFGPETYVFIREREGGTHQNGRIDGLRITFDRIKSYGWYIGAEYFYAGGELKGKTGRGSPLRSNLTDQIYEIRLGITFENSLKRGYFFTPFGGWGYFEEKNAFYIPSPLPCTFTDTFNYIAAGFLSGVNFNSLLSMGINFKVKFMQNGKSKVSEDPLMDDVTLLMKNELQLRLDVPFACHPCKTLLGTGFLLSPFFEYRHFGGREGFPFNFADTKFYLYGARFALTYRF